MEITQFLHPLLMKLTLVTTILVYIAVTYLDIALGVSKAVKIGKETIQQCFTSRTFLYSLPLKFTLITAVGLLYWIGNLLSHELGVILTIPLFVYEISSILENLKDLGISYKAIETIQNNDGGADDNKE